MADLEAREVPRGGRHRVAASRRAAIRELVADRGGASISDLSSYLGASKATVHRDLERMARDGAIVRVRGGATLPGPAPDDADVRHERHERVAAKQAIARRARELVEPGSSIFLEASTTVAQLGRLLRSIEPLTVVTNDPTIALDLVTNGRADVILVGGTLRRQTLATVGPLADGDLQRLRVDVAFVGITAIEAERGISSMNVVEAQTKRAIFGVAERRIGLADARKLGRAALTVVAPATALTTLITDSAADQREVERLRGLGVEVDVVSVRES